MTSLIPTSCTKHAKNVQDGGLHHRHSLYTSTYLTKQRPGSCGNLAQEPHLIMLADVSYWKLEVHVFLYGSLTFHLFNAALYLNCYQRLQACSEQDTPLGTHQCSTSAWICTKEVNKCMCDDVFLCMTNKYIFGKLNNKCFDSLRKDEQGVKSICVNLQTVPCEKSTPPPYLKTSIPGRKQDYL